MEGLREEERDKERGNRKEIKLRGKKEIGTKEKLRATNINRARLCVWGRRPGSGRMACRVGRNHLGRKWGDWSGDEGPGAREETPFGQGAGLLLGGDHFHRWGWRDRRPG